ncbi:TIGR02444 family protein [Lacimicrobium alkaliphilum]|uniref:TIGR02444 family protein n=1 Tax=Lacimicrobium alkaliphilum TaxID=1526571 RepID=A0A0U2ZAX4_9ALTE|nr:TIGR02444 family protein [Lacimicrobium alkaliphilum]ALT00068.1 hypothetical protein AT746_18540 [Lacimicrobium alkaliphilum]
MTLSASDFWDFSLKVYPDWQQTLLLLQDDYDLNINLLLFCLYLEQRNQRLSAQQMATLMQNCEQTRPLLMSLREVRRAAKGVNQQAYSQLKQAELELEKQQQQALIRAANSMQFSEVQGKGNLQSYVELKQLTDSEALQKLLNKLVY